MPHLIFVRKPYTSGHQVVNLTEAQKMTASYNIKYFSNYGNTLISASLTETQKANAAYTITGLTYV